MADDSLLDSADNTGTDEGTSEGGATETGSTEGGQGGDGSDGGSEGGDGGDTGTEDEGGKGKEGGEDEGGDKAKTKEGEGDNTSGAPEAYDLNLGEHPGISEQQVEAVTTLARELDLDNDQAQKLASLANDLVVQHDEANIQILVDQSATWYAEVAEKHGGKDSEDFAEAKRLAALAWEQAPAELKTGVTELHMQNNPYLFEMMRDFGSRMDGDKFVRGGASKGGPKTHAQRVYPDHKSEDNPVSALPS